MSLVYALHLTRVYRYLVVLFVVAGITLAVGSLSLNTSWQATSSVLVGSEGSAANPYPNSPERFIRSQVRVVTSDAVLERATAKLTGTSVATLRDAIAVSGGSVDDVLDIRVTAATEQAAGARLEAVVAAYLAESNAAPELLESGEPRPSTARATRLALGGAGGLAVGVLAALMLGAVRRPITGSSQLEDLEGVEVYPFELRRRGGRGSVPRARGFADLASWISRRDGHPVDLVVAAVGESSAGKPFATGLAKASSAGVRVLGHDAATTPDGADHSGRSEGLVILVVKNRTSERALDKHVRAHGHLGSPVTVVVADRIAAARIDGGAWV